MILALSTVFAMEGTPMGDDLPEEALDVRAELAGRGFVLLPESGVSRGFALARSRLSTRLLGPHGASLRVAMVGTRSGGTNGYIGIEGETFVPRLQIAEARWDAPDLGLALAAGIVDDLWTGTSQAEWAHPELAVVPTLAQDVLDRSDLGGWISWTAPEARVSISLSVTSGEGETRRERNNGVNIAGLLTVRPLLTDDASVTLRVVGREGSRGAVQSRNHRFGGSARLDHERFVASAMAMAGWGSNDADGTLEPFLASVYARTSTELPFVAIARFDYALAHRPNGDTRTTDVFLAGGPRLPLKSGAPAWLTLGWQGTRNGPEAGPVSGVVTGNDLLFLQLSTDLSARIPLEVTP